MNIAEAVSRLGYEETDDESLCIARFRNGHLVQSTLAGCGHRDLAEFGDVYIASGAFRRGAIQKDSGRTRKNLARVTDCPFDFDLSDYLGLPKHVLYGLSAEELDYHLLLLREDAGEVLSLLDIPTSLWIKTGYGLLALARVASVDQKRIDDCIALHSHLVDRINEVAGTRLADIQVRDAGTRLIRLPGCVNTKGTVPRPCTILEEVGDDFLFLDRFDIEQKPRNPPRILIPDHAQELSAEDEKDIILALNGEWWEGNRHAVALGVSGMMAKAGIPESQATRIIEACSASDPEQRDRLRAVQTSYKRVRSGLQVAGFMRLKDDVLPDHVLQFIDAKLQAVRPQVLGFIDLGTGEEPRSSPSRFLPCPEEAFYGWFNDYRQLMATTTEASDAFHIGTALVYAGLFVGRAISVHLGTTIYPNLYLSLVGETGRSRKDTAMSRGQFFFLSTHTNPRDLALTFHPFSQLYGVTSGEGLIDHLKDNPATLLKLSELSTMVRRARRQGTLTLMPTLIELWDSPARIDIPRAGKDSVRSVALPFVSILAATTPQTLADDMTGGDIESGFGNRVLWFFGEGKPPIDDPPKPDAARAAFLFNELMQAIGQIPYGTEMVLKKQAKEMWREWYHAQYHRQYGSEDDARMAQRMGANIHKIALLFAASEATATIDLPHLSAATTLVEWSFENTRHEARRWGWNDESRIAIAIKDSLRSGPGTRSSISKFVGERVAPTALYRTLDAMVKMEQVACVSSGVYQLPQEC